MQQLPARRPLAAAGSSGRWRRNKLFCGRTSDLRSVSRLPQSGTWKFRMRHAVGEISRTGELDVRRRFAELKVSHAVRMERFRRLERLFWMLEPEISFIVFFITSAHVFKMKYTARSDSHNIKQISPIKCSAICGMISAVRSIRTQKTPTKTKFEFRNLRHATDEKEKIA